MYHKTNVILTFIYLSIFCEVSHSYMGVGWFGGSDKKLRGWNFMKNRDFSEISSYSRPFLTFLSFSQIFFRKNRFLTRKTGFEQEKPVFPDTSFDFGRLHPQNFAPAHVCSHCDFTYNFIFNYFQRTFRHVIKLKFISATALPSRWQVAPRWRASPFSTFPASTVGATCGAPTVSKRRARQVAAACRPFGPFSTRSAPIGPPARPIASRSSTSTAGSRVRNYVVFILSNFSYCIHIFGAFSA